MTNEDLRLLVASRCVRLGNQLNSGHTLDQEKIKEDAIHLYGLLRELIDEAEGVDRGDGDDN